jgi:hypothetical protein
MRAVFEEVTSAIPFDQATPAIKAHIAEVILNATAVGETSYDGLLAAASTKLEAILSAPI